MTKLSEAKFIGLLLMALMTLGVFLCSAAVAGAAEKKEIVVVRPRAPDRRHGAERHRAEVGL